MQVLTLRFKGTKREPRFKEFSYQENPKRYFYPASTVKLPVAILALEKIEDYKDKEWRSFLLAI